MNLFLFGLNHNTAPLELRETLSISEKEYHSALSDFLNYSNAHSAFILSTCNRTEIFFEADDENLALSWLLSYKNIDKSKVDNYKSHFYVYRKFEVITHLIRVASGLDALVLGEAQIFGQFKKALFKAKEIVEFSKVADKIFQTVISATKEIRTDTSIGKNSLSIPYITINLAKKYFDDFSNKKALLIGAGETIELCLKYLLESNISEIFLVNRNIDNAYKITKDIASDKIFINNLSEIINILPNIDIIISATASENYLINLTDIDDIKNNKKIFVADLAVPRDIDPKIAELENIKLYSVDDLKYQLENNLDDREQGIVSAEKIIEKYIVDFSNWVKVLKHLDLLNDYREHIERHKKEALDKSLLLLSQGATPEEAIKRSLDLLANKIMHCPTLYIKNCAEAGDFSNLELVKDIYNL